MQKTKIVVCGAAGKMGSSIIRLSGADSELETIGALESKGHPSVGKAVISSEKNQIIIMENLSDIINECNVIIDFTNPSSTLEHVEVASKHKKAIVIGTTGLKQDEIEKIKAASKNIPVIFSPNMSIGVNLLFKLVGEVARAIPDYDVEIVELHHNQKKDAPSGTAVKLSQIAASELKRNIDKVGVYGRHGVIGARKHEEIGVLSVRAGDIVGEHTVYFAGLGERVELTHKAHSRDTFASGALYAAKWLVKQKPGLYDMQDVLNLK